MQTNGGFIIFPGDDCPAPIEEAGGKGYSLIRLSGAGLPVPPGCVLTTAFFEPWYASLRETDAWRTLKASEPPVPGSCARALEAYCSTLVLSPVQRETLDQALRRLDPVPRLWAVRSSSPAEDLGDASFAGLYRTEIGVPRAGLEDAIRRVFASCFDEKVLSYRPETRRDSRMPQMAVIVQAMVAADVSGIAFSANPANNCREEVVINAGWGLGETIVSGHMSPDELVLAKSGTTILARKTGAKETALFLHPEEGIRECHGFRSDQFCLEDRDAYLLRDLVRRVEELYGRPVDIEWALR